MSKLLRFFFYLLTLLVCKCLEYIPKYVPDMLLYYYFRYFLFLQVSVFLIRYKGKPQKNNLRLRFRARDFQILLNLGPWVLYAMVYHFTLRDFNVKQAIFLSNLTPSQGVNKSILEIKMPQSLHAKYLRRNHLTK